MSTRKSAVGVWSDLDFAVEHHLILKGLADASGSRLTGRKQFERALTWQIRRATCSELLEAS
jgi:hypothetical protein